MTGLTSKISTVRCTDIVRCQINKVQIQFCQIRLHVISCNIRFINRLTVNFVDNIFFVCVVCFSCGKLCIAEDLPLSFIGPNNNLKRKI